MTGTSVFTSKGIRRPAIERRPREIGPGTLVFRGSRGFAVFMPQELYERLLRFSSDGSGLEWIGFLAGQVFEDDEGAYVRLTGIMPHLVAERSVARVRVPAEATRAARHETERYFPDSRLLGWAHSHPRGSSARFSSTDREYQADWPDPWSIGVVVEPTDNAVLRVYRGPEAELLEPVASTDVQPSSPPVPASGRDDASNIALALRGMEPREKGWKRAALFAAGLVIIGACTAHVTLFHDLRMEASKARRALEQSALASAQLAHVAENMLRRNAPRVESCCSCEPPLTNTVDSPTQPSPAGKAKPRKRSDKVAAPEAPGRGGAADDAAAIGRAAGTGGAHESPEVGKSAR